MIFPTIIPSNKSYTIIGMGLQYFSPDCLIDIIKVVHLHPNPQLFLQKLLVLPQPRHQSLQLPYLPRPKHLNYLLHLIVHAGRLNDAGWCLQVFLKYFHLLEDLPFEQEPGHVDILDIILDILDKQIGNFPAKDNPSGQPLHLSIPPGEISRIIDFPKSGQQLVVPHREGIPHIIPSLFIAIEFHTRQKHIIP